LGERFADAVSKATFITTQRTVFGIPYATSCRALGVSQAWYYKWRRGWRGQRATRRHLVDAMVAYLFHLHRGDYGSPRITDDLKALGWAISKNTVAGSMRAQGLVARPKKKRRSLTKADKSARKAPDLLQRNFGPPPATDTAWVGDLTELPNDEGRFYLAAVLDLAGRRCVGFAMSERHDSQVATAALQTAVAIRGGHVDGVTMHTDQGGEYTGALFKLACVRCGITQSMGRTGSALDNAVAESFNSTLEFELLSKHHFTTRQQTRRAVAAWVDDYNLERRHTTNKIDGLSMSPVAYEQAQARARRSDQNAA
jgi:transposase InsO family protein